MLKINRPIIEPCVTPFDKPNHSLYLSPNFLTFYFLHLIHKLEVANEKSI